jgi:hypothetical protein
MVHKDLASRVAKHKVVEVEVEDMVKDSMRKLHEEHKQFEVALWIHSTSFLKVRGGLK